VRPAALGLLVACALLAAAVAAAEAPPPPGPPPAPARHEDPLAFADALCQAGDYFRAVGEYKRVIYLEPKGSGGEARARLHLGACYARAGAYQEAVDLLSPLAQGEGPEAEPALFELALTYHLAGLNERAAEAFERLTRRCPDSPLATRAAILAGYSELAGADHGAAAKTFGALAKRGLPCAAELERAATQPALPPTSPVAAALLSATLPGAGHLYCGRPALAAASFVLTGLSVFGAWAALRNGYEGAGTLAAFVAATAYAGGIRSAYSCARQRNRDSRQGWLTGLARRCNLDLVPGGVALSY
jgi:tetratricopeptide (TPR) repeat protein